MLLYRSKHNLPNKARTATSVAFSNDLKNWQVPDDNPVLADAMSWQGIDDQGRAHRTWGATLIQWEKYLISYYIDRVGRYPGMRAFGVAYSSDGIGWNQVDKPFFTVEDVKRIIPDKHFSADPVFTHGRVYPHFATVDGDYIYLIINTIVNGKHDGRQYQRFIIRGTDPFDSKSFAFVETPWLDSGDQFQAFYKINDFWFRLRNLSIREDGELFRYIAIDKTKNLAEPFTKREGIPTHIPNNTGGRSLFYFNDFWHIIYSDRNGHIHLLTEIKK